MAKKNNKNKGANGRPKARAPRKRGARPQGTPASGFLSLLQDPCNGPIDSHYGGEKGIVQRFVQDFTLNATPGDTCGYLVFCPAQNVYLRFQRASDDLAGSPTSTPGPGVPFLNGSARKIRSLAACVTVLPAAVSMTNMTGEIAVGNISWNTIEASGTYSVAQVFQLTNTRAVIAKRKYDVKWYPQLMDATYAPYSSGGAGSLSDPSDHNAIIIAWRGYPAGAALSFRLTNVIEWTPAHGTGIAATTMPAPAVDHQNLAAMLHRYNPSWWHDVVEHAGQEAGKGLKFLTSLGVRSAVRYGMSALPALTL